MAATGLQRFLDRPAVRMLFSREGSFQAGVAWNVASLVVLGLSGIAINVLIATWRGADDLGVFNQAYAIYIFASQVAVGGVQFSVLHYVSHHPDEREECARITSSGLVIAVVLAMVVAAVVMLSRHAVGAILDSPAVATALVAVSPGLVFFSLNKVLLAVMNGLRQMRAYAVFQSLRFLFILTGVVILLSLEVSGSLLAGAFTLAEALLLILLLGFFELRAVPIRARYVVSRWPRRHLSFGARSFLSGTLSELNTRVDVLALGFFVSDSLVGVYSFAAIFAEGFNQLPHIVRNNLDPLLGNRFADGSLARIEGYARQIRAFFWPGMAVIGALAVVAYVGLIGLFFGTTEFMASRGVFAVLILGVVLSSGYRPFVGILLQGGRPATYTLLVTLVVVVNLIGNLLLIPILGILGAAAATSAALVIEAALIVVLSRWLFGVRL